MDGDALRPAVPAHVDPSWVFKFDMHHDARLEGDLHQQLTTLHRDAPDIFWTPDNTGHWVVTRYDLIDEICKDHDRFSARGAHVPYTPGGLVSIPLNLDPPDHTYYRQILMRHFGPPAIKALEPKVQSWAQRLVASVAADGHCDFMDSVGSLYPVSIFMELMGLPLEKLREYRGWVMEYFSDVPNERRFELEKLIGGEMRKVLTERQENPRDDMASKLLRDELDGRRMTMNELEDLSNLLFQAGMDTVVNFAGFFFRYMGDKPELQRQIREHPETIPDIVEEGFRMFGVVNNGRVVRVDTEFGGVKMREGDSILCMLPLAGMDERKNPNPTEFNISRANREHMLFSKGVHLCIGHTLARSEMRILLAEWFKAIPEYRIAPGYKPNFRAGQVMGLGNLPLEWDAPKR